MTLVLGAVSQQEKHTFPFIGKESPYYIHTGDLLMAVGCDTLSAFQLMHFRKKKITSQGTLPVRGILLFSGQHWYCWSCFHSSGHQGRSLLEPPVCRAHSCPGMPWAWLRWFSPVYNALSSKSTSVYSETIAVAGGSAPRRRNIAEVYGCRLGWSAQTLQGLFAN